MAIGTRPDKRIFGILIAYFTYSRGTKKQVSEETPDCRCPYSPINQSNNNVYIF
jgi:hypothetical protein